MRNILNFRFLTSVCAALVLAGCATKQAPATPNAQLPAAATAPAAPVSPSILAGSAKDFQVNVGDTVHFEYNRTDIGDEDRATLQRQATWLNKYPAVRVMIEGHCDERGTRAYNLALGAKRAEAVKEYLASIGVAAARMGTISYGKERPVCSESNDACWAKNRRGVTTLSGGVAS